MSSRWLWDREGWRQQVDDPDLRLWLLIALGGVVTIIPIALVRFRPGTALTRYTIAACQMFHSGILISLSGGRSETHFHVFCSLVILSLYRDWRVFISGYAGRGARSCVARCLPSGFGLRRLRCACLEIRSSTWPG